MPPFKDTALERELKRWMRSDARNFVRPDWRRFVVPGSEAAAVFGVYEQKYRDDQLRDELGRWADEGGGAAAQEPNPLAPPPKAPAVSPEPTAGSGRSDPRVLSDATPENIEKPGAQIAARISPALGEKCEFQYRQDIFKCNLLGTMSCWEQAAFRYSQCLRGGYIPPLYF
jgi:hypothetical protein